MRIVNLASLRELLPGVWKLSVLSCFSTKHKLVTAVPLAGDEKRSGHSGKQIKRQAPDLLKMVRRNALLCSVSSQQPDKWRISGVPGIGVEVILEW